MHFKGRIETTFMTILPIVGLDMAEKRRLLDQRSADETNCQVARFDNSLTHKYPASRMENQLAGYLNSIYESDGPITGAGSAGRSTTYQAAT